MNDLERHGWISLARERFGLQLGEAKALFLLIRNAGRFCDHASLDNCSRSYESGRPRQDDVSRRLPTRISRIRSALVDVGIPSSAVENNPGVGYAIPARYALQISNMVERLSTDQST